MHKWQTNFAWQMIGFAILLFLMGGGMMAQAWLSWSNVLANPAKLLLPTVGLVVAAVVAIYVAFICLNVGIRTRKHSAKMKEMEKNRPPLTLSKLREELQPENQERFRTNMFKMLQSMPPEAKGYTEAKMKGLVEKYRADLGSTAEVEIELSKLEALIRDVLDDASAITARN